MLKKINLGIKHNEWFYDKRSFKRHRLDAINSFTDSSALKIKNYNAKLDCFYSKISLNNSFRAENRRWSIAIVAHVLGDSLFGSENSYMDMVKTINGLGYRTIAVVPFNSSRNSIKELAKISSKVVEINYCASRQLELNTEYVEIFNRLIVEESIDIIYANTITLPECLKAAQLSKILSITHVRELPFEDSDLCTAFNISAESWCRRTYELSDILVMNSTYTAKAFYPNHIHPNQYIIPNMCNPPTIIPKSTFETGRLRCCMISSNVPKKGIDDFFEIAKKCNHQGLNVEFNLYGPRNSFVENIIKKCAQEGVDNFNVHSYINSSSIALESNDILFSISLFSESFGRTVTEALSCGVPVFVRDKGYPPFLVNHGESGWILDENIVESSVKFIKMFLNLSKADYCQISENCKKASVKFSRSFYTREVHSLLKRIKEKSKLQPANFLGKEEVMRRPVHNSHPISPEEFKLGYFCWHFPVPSETWVINELRELERRGIDVEIFCKEMPHKEFKPGLKYAIHKVTTPEHLGQLLIDYNITIIHAHFIHPTVSQFIWPACKIAKTKFTCTAHAQDIFKYDSIKCNKVSEWSQSELLVKIFTLSSYHVKCLIDQGAPPHKITILPNSIDTAFFSAKPVASKKDSKTPFTVVTVNRFVEKKGIENLIKAASLCPDVSFLVYGYGELEATYLALIDQLKLKNVKLMGKISNRDDLANVLGKASLFCLPCVQAENGDMDGIPTSIIEAMAFGIPCLTSDISGLSSLIRDGFNGFFCKSKKEEIASSILRIQKMNSNIIYQISKNARFSASQNHNVVSTISKAMSIWANKEIDIGIVSFNNLIEMDEVIKRIYSYTTAPFHLIICDNFSDSETREYLYALYKKYTNITINFSLKNNYVGPGTNICLSLGDNPIFIYVCGKEGMAVNHGWEFLFTRRLTINDSKKIGLIGTQVYNPKMLTGKQIIDSEIFKDLRPKEFIFNNTDQEFNQIQGGLFAINRTMFDQIGGFSYKLPHNHTDVEYGLYSQSKGWNHQYLDDNISVWNKSRPSIYSRVNSETRAFHPSSYKDLKLIDELIQGHKWICNICETCYPVVDVSEICSNCGSNSIERLIWKQLINSNLLFRRIPALVVGQNGPLMEKLNYHFQGPKLPNLDDNIYSNSDFKLPNNSSKLSVMILVEPFEKLLCKQKILKEFCRVSTDNVRIISYSNETMSINMLQKNFQNFMRSADPPKINLKQICCYVNRIHSTLALNTLDK